MDIITASELRNKIKQLNRLNTDNVEFRYLKELVSNMHAGLATEVCESGLAEPIYRVRVNPEKKPQHINELKAPEANLVTGYQRCNSPNNPMFYASSRRATALLECDVQAGDIAYISQWRTDKRFTINTSLKSDAFKGERNPTQLMLISDFEHKFCTPIHDTYSSRYKITAAIAELLTGRYSFNPRDNLGALTKNRIGLYYPSVPDIERGYNMALPPEIVEHHLTLAHVMEAEIINREGSSFTVKALDNSNIINSGNIQWTGDASQTPLQKISLSGRTGVLYNFHDGEWRLAVKSLPSTSQELNVLIEE